jgi:hypothetical protein
MFRTYIYLECNMRCTIAWCDNRRYSVPEYQKWTLCSTLQRRLERRGLPIPDELDWLCAAVDDLLRSQDKSSAR